MIFAIDHINIVVNDLEQMMIFFELLGFQLLHQGELEGEWISQIVGLADVKARYVSMELPNTQTKLELLKYFSPKSPEPEAENRANLLGFRHIAFKVKGIESLVEKLKMRKVEFLSDINLYTQTNKKLVYFKGPEGILLELAEYGDLRCIE